MEKLQKLALLLLLLSLLLLLEEDDELLLPSAAVCNRVAAEMTSRRALRLEGCAAAMSKGC